MKANLGNLQRLRTKGGEKREEEREGGRKGKKEGREKWREERKEIFSKNQSHKGPRGPSTIDTTCPSDPMGSFLWLLRPG